MFWWRSVLLNQTSNHGFVPPKDFNQMVNYSNRNLLPVMGITSPLIQQVLKIFCNFPSKCFDGGGKHKKAMKFIGKISSHESFCKSFRK